jgi:uncharacterized protein YjiS (DUF1127 family)
MTYFNQNCPQTFVETPVGFTSYLSRIVGQWLQNQRLRSRIRSERRSLMTMSNEMLKDIGIDRTAAVQEAQQKDVPAIRIR